MRFFLFLCFSLLLSLSKTIAQTSNEEEQAILAVIEAETQDFARLPFAEVARKHWILDKNTFIIATDGKGDATFVSAEDMLKNESVAPEEKTKVEKTNYLIQINGNMATVYHHQTVTLLDFGVTLYSHESRTLEKVDGAWKIHNSTVLYYTPK
jgi:hypothetical protein